jgi:hypothetical protein
MKTITFSDGEETYTVDTASIQSVTFEESEFSSSYEATYYYIETEEDVLVADLEHTDSTEFEHIQSIADSDYLASEAADDYVRYVEELVS